MSGFPLISRTSPNFGADGNERPGWPELVVVRHFATKTIRLIAAKITATEATCSKRV